MPFTRSDLPDDFVIGTATAAYQVEGSVDVDGRGPSIWDDFARVPGAIADGSTGEPADDHLRRYREDVALMADLGVDAYRFSISWPRIQADGTGPANRAGIDHYRRITEALLERGITPWATLYHWDLPSALEARGGWLERDTADRFAEYTGLVAEALGDLVDHWITLNEPWCSAFLGYASGVHAPGKQLGSRAAHAAHHLMLGHGRAVRALRAAAPSAQVGVTLNLYSVRPASESPADQDAARRIDGLQNRLFLEPLLLGHYPEDVLRDLGEEAWFAANPASDAAEIAADVDFVGVNYYSRHTVRAGATDPADAGGDAGAGAAADATAADGVPATNAGGAVAAVSANPGSESVETVDTGAARTQMGWEIHPDGLVDVLRMVHALRPELPIAVTENGAAYEDVVDASGAVEDEERRAYVEAHLAACGDAVREGIPLRGYFCWSLLDNWEWAFGYTRRFGIVHVDFTTQQRTIKRSGRWLAGILGGPAAADTTTTDERAGADA